MSAHKIQGFVTGYSVAYPCIGEDQGAGPMPIGTSEQGGAMKSYGTVAMNYIQLSAFERSDEGAGSRCSNVEDDNRVLTNLARRTGVSEAGKKLPACGLGGLASALGNANNALTIVSAQKLVRRCDRRRL